MRESLRVEVERFLRTRGPSRSTDIAAGVRARRVDVHVLLASCDRFERAPYVEGSDARAVLWRLSRPVPSRLTARAEAMLELIEAADGVSRGDLVAAGIALPNNAASELRQQGYDVRSGRRGGVYFYRLMSRSGR